MWRNFLKLAFAKILFRIEQTPVSAYRKMGWRNAT